MKHQLDKQVVESDPIESDPDEDINIKDWSPEEVQKRSSELNLIDFNGVCKSPAIERKTAKQQNGTFDPIITSKSPSRSTTPDSQITVRSSPMSANRLDTISVCRDCSTKCKSRLSSSSSNSLIIQRSLTSQRCESKSEEIGRSASLASNESSLSSATSTITGATSERGELKSESAGSSSANQNLVSQSPSTKSTKSAGSTDINSNRNPEYRIKNTTPCECKCTPKDFEGSTLSPDELKQETVKIIENFHEIKKPTTTLNGVLCTPQRVTGGAKTLNDDDCLCDRIDDMSSQEADDWSLMLIGLAQINPAATLVSMDPFEAVPTISVVPPTPESHNSKRFSPNSWEPSKLSPDENEDRIVVPRQQSSFSDDSPQEEEPPYLALNTGLKRYGTMSSLERVPSEDTDEKTYNSSEEDSENGELPKL